MAITAGLAVSVIAILMMQPDVGMAMVVGAVWFAQIFIAGLPLVLVVVLAFVGVAAAAGAYAAFPHVAEPH